jgi:serine/threonine-protein kinase
MDGATEAVAREALAAADLKVGTVVREHHETIPDGHLITWRVGGEDRPPEVPKFTAVDLVVSGGPAPRTVPGLQGATEAEATSELQKLGLQVTRSEAFSDDVAAGQVIGTKPGAGTKVGRGSSVEIVVSRGPDLVEVPDVRGMSYDQALATLEGAGLQGGEVAGRGSKVRATDPAAGEQVRRGTEVNMLLGR